MKIGLVLAGGGGRGAYQIGVWKALKEFGFDKYIRAISGTSIGALNAALFVSGSVDEAEKLWLNLSKEVVLPTRNIDLVKKSLMLAWGAKNINFVKKYIPKTLEIGDISREGLLKLLDEHIDFSRIVKSTTSLYAACSEIPSIKPKYFKLNSYKESDIKEILLATSAIPVVFESKEIEDKKYLDGGMADNLPIQPIYGEGCDIIIAVNLSKSSELDRSIFPNTKIIEIVPRDMDDGILSSTLDFTPSGARRRIKQGYDDTKNLFEPIIELTKYSFMKIPQEIVASAGKSFLRQSNKIKNVIVSGNREH
ncbi:patatin-like phospholipase family protein [Clostridium manihotivorum]|uniref:Phospholipase n=1 Tax=Clostridium manihotivorum TaxID=2320868 RepID=A0A410DMB6_9CLOT|nr:patatin-like phospholipase family protein [Clostridium manihotivorum]QAA30218.1 phospholipase [Clostridium manihotivorum]